MEDRDGVGALAWVLRVGLGFAVSEESMKLRGFIESFCFLCSVQ